MLKALKELALYMPRQIKMAINFDKEIDRVGLQAKALNEHVAEIGEEDYCDNVEVLTAYFNKHAQTLPADMKVDFICHRHEETEWLDFNTMQPQFDEICADVAHVVSTGKNSCAVVVNMKAVEYFDDSTREAIVAHELSHIKNNDLPYVKNTLQQKALLNTSIMLSGAAICAGVTPWLFGGLVVARGAHTIVDRALMRNKELAADKTAVEDFGAAANGLYKYLKHAEIERPVYGLSAEQKLAYRVLDSHVLRTHPTAKERLEALGYVN